MASIIYFWHFFGGIDGIFLPAFGRIFMKLTDTVLRSLKPTGKPQKYSDGGGLYLYVSAAGGKLWRMDYRFEGKRKTLSFGPYPAIGMGDARKLREEAKEKIVNGIDPGTQKKQLRPPQDLKLRTALK